MKNSILLFCIFLINVGIEAQLLPLRTEHSLNGTWQFTPKGEAVYLSVMGENKVRVYDADSYELLKEIPVRKPSGIFCTDRTSKFGL